MKQFFGILLLSSFLSCGSKTDYFELIKKSDNGLIRGVDIGVGFDQIKSIEKQNPDSEDEKTYLHYTLDLTNNQSLTTEYSIDDNGLYEIQLELHLTDSKDILKVYEKLKEHFSAKLGNPIHAEENGVVVWIGKSGPSNKTEVTLIEDNTEGDLSISIIDNDFGDTEPI